MIQRATTGDLAALLAGAAMCSRAGNRVAAIAALLTAVQLDPLDRTAHRRLAAAYANAGDRSRAGEEYEGYARRLDAVGRSADAAVERAYAASLLGLPRSSAEPRAIASGPAPVVRTVARERAGLTAEQSRALRRIAIAVAAIGMTLAAMFTAGPEILARAI